MKAGVLQSMVYNTAVCSVTHLRNIPDSPLLFFNDLWNDAFRSWAYWVLHYIHLQYLFICALMCRHTHMVDFEGETLWRRNEWYCMDRCVNGTEL